VSGSVNKVIIIGNLGADPEGRDAGSGRVVNLRIATSRNYTDKQGQRHEDTEWHSVTLWNKLGELAERYLKKGRSVYIEGRLKTRDWVDQKTGEKRYKTEIVAHEMTFLGGDGDRRPSAGGQTSQPQSRPSQPRKSKSYDQPTGQVGPTSNPYKDDEIPF
jgi:single-strand DNA-binding protein